MLSGFKLKREKRPRGWFQERRQASAPHRTGCGRHANGAQSPVQSTNSTPSIPHRPWGPLSRGTRVLIQKMPLGAAPWDSLPTALTGHGLPSLGDGDHEQ